MICLKKYIYILHKIWKGYCNIFCLSDSVCMCVNVSKDCMTTNCLILIKDCLIVYVEKRGRERGEREREGGREGGREGERFWRSK